MKPIGKKIIASKCELEEQKGTLIVDIDMNHHIQAMRIEAIGDITADLKVGDKIIVRKHCGYPFTHGNQELVRIHEDEVLALVETH